MTMVCVHLDAMKSYNEGLPESQFSLIEHNLSILAFGYHWHASRSSSAGRGARAEGQKAAATASLHSCMILGRRNAQAKSKGGFTLYGAGQLKDSQGMQLSGSNQFRRLLFTFCLFGDGGGGG